MKYVKSSHFRQIYLPTSVAKAARREAEVRAEGRMLAAQAELNEDRLRRRHDELAERLEAIINQLGKSDSTPSKISALIWPLSLTACFLIASLLVPELHRQSQIRDLAAREQDQLTRQTYNIQGSSLAERKITAQFYANMTRTPEIRQQWISYRQDLLREDTEERHKAGMASK